MMARNEIIIHLEALACAGRTVLIYGPLGIGKSTILKELRSRISAIGCPCGFAIQTRTLRNVTEALALAYPEVKKEFLTQQQIKGRLRSAVEREPGVLLLDHLLGVGNATKGYLRSLRGTGLGVVISADVEDREDLERVRTCHLAYQEMEIPPLSAKYLRRLLDKKIFQLTMPNNLTKKDYLALLKISAGRPGWIILLTQRLTDPRYWTEGRVKLEVLRADVLVDLNIHFHVPEEGAARLEGRGTACFFPNIS